MEHRANVASVEAIEAFRSALIIYISQARPAVEEISADVMRTRAWLEDEKRTFWENQVRKRAKALEEAKQALFSGRISMLGHESAAQQMEVHRAKRAADEAEDKLRVVKRWRREFDGRVQPLVKQVEKLHTVLTQDLVQAVAFLTKVQDVLAAYTEKAAVSPGSQPGLPPVQTDAVSGKPGEAPSKAGTMGENPLEAV